MADSRAFQQGFTLAEMLAALGILMVTVTTLLASLADSVALRRATDMRLSAAAAVEDVVLQVQRNGIEREIGAESDLDLALKKQGPYELDNMPGLRFFVSVIDARDRSDVWLLKIVAEWMEAGEIMQEEFLRALPRELPMADRVARFREEDSETVR
jgi:prepilin-type N-terminal cleavage/methylation domain-containing protein